MTITGTHCGNHINQHMLSNKRKWALEMWVWDWGEKLWSEVSIQLRVPSTILWERERQESLWVSESWYEEGEWQREEAQGEWGESEWYPEQYSDSRSKAPTRLAPFPSSSSNWSATLTHVILTHSFSCRFSDWALQQNGATVPTFNIHLPRASWA